MGLPQGCSGGSREVLYAGRKEAVGKQQSIVMLSRGVLTLLGLRAWAVAYSMFSRYVLPMSWLLFVPFSWAPAKGI